MNPRHGFRIISESHCRAAGRTFNASQYLRAEWSGCRNGRRGASLGTVLDKAATAKEAIQAARLDWTVIKQPVVSFSPTERQFPVQIWDESNPFAPVSATRLETCVNESGVKFRASHHLTLMCSDAAKTSIIESLRVLL